MVFSEKDALFLNYFKFMGLFRGTVNHDSAISSVLSERKEFIFSVPHSADTAALLFKSPTAPTLLIPTNFEVHPPETWKRSGGITFMTMKSGVPKVSGENASKIIVVSGNDAQIVKDYSTAQCAGFLETPEAYSGWASWLTEANHKNVGNMDVHFYVAYADKVPVGGAITVKSDSCKGIYGVATSPKYRKQGVGKLLLQQILASSTTMVVGLQVETGSYAHQYYRKLAFKDVFELGRFKNEN